MRKFREIDYAIQILNNHIAALINWESILDDLISKTFNWKSAVLFFENERCIEASETPDTQWTERFIYSSKNETQFRIFVLQKSLLTPQFGLEIVCITIKSISRSLDVFNVSSVENWPKIRGDLSEHKV